MLLMIGGHEILCDPHKALNDANQSMSNISVTLIPDAGHTLNANQPGEVGRLALDFLPD